MEARVRCPLGDVHSAHTLLEHTQGESHPQKTINTQNDPNLLNIHRYEGKTTRATLTWYKGLSSRSIDSFDTLVEHFSSQYTTSRSHRMTSVALASL
ncbi:hypothetical protein JHK87_015925 [Glycine soja]|nr:hypothetical protein JHK87_015925 [Glycine soja]